MARTRRGRKPAPKPSEAVLESPISQIKRVRPTTELVARSGSANFWGAYKDYLTRLPRATDDLSKELGIDVLERMYNDPQIAASTDTLVLQALSRELRAKPRYPRGHSMYKKGVEAYDTISYCLDILAEDSLGSLEVGLHTTLEDMCRSMLKYGNCVAEQTWRIHKGGPLSGKMVLGSLKPKPPEVYGFVVDSKGNVPAIAAYTGDLSLEEAGPYKSYVPRSVSTVLDKVEMPVNGMESGWELLPVSKFMVMTHRRKAGDPRGQSAFRQAFNAWYLLMQLWPEFLKYLTQFATPSIKGILGPKAIAQRDPLDPTKIQDPADVLYEELVNFANGSVVVAANGTEIDVLWSQGEGAAFITAINLLNHQIVKSFLGTVLATEAPHNQTRAAQQGGKDILDLPTRGLKRTICNAVYHQMFRRLMHFNYGPEAAFYLTPLATLGDIAPEDRIEGMKVASQMTQSGFLHEEQLAGLDDWLELDARTSPEFGPAIRAGLDLTVAQTDQTEANAEATRNPPAPAEPGVTKEKNSAKKKSKSSSSGPRDADGDGVVNEKRRA